MKIPSALRACALVVGCGVALQAGAEVRFHFDYVFNGADPESVPPWLTASFETVSPGMVNMTLELKLEIDSEFVSDIAFNLNPAYGSQTPVFQQTSGTPFSTILFAPNAVSLSGAGAAGRGFDFRVSWPNSGGGRFSLLETASFTIALPGLVAEDFVYSNPSGIAMAAHIQGIPGANATTLSGAIGGTQVPEPSTFSVALAGAAALYLFRRRDWRTSG